MRTCTDCGHELAVFSQSMEQVANPVIGQTYYLSANVDGQLLSFISGGVTETSPYSLRTSETLATVTAQAALEAGKGEFQLVDGSNRFVYSIDAGVGLTTSTNYITYPEKVSFSMDIVNGQSVIRAYGTNLILAAKYSDTKSAWRIFAVDESEIGTEGVHPVTLSVAHEHTLGKNWVANADGTTSQLCTVCGFENIFYGGDIRVSKVEEPLIGESYYLGANVAGTMMYFRHGTVGDSVPYSLVVTDNFNHNWTSQVTLEDPTATDEKYTEGFQFTYINPKDNVLSRIYCMDALKDATVAGQTGIMDTGVNTTIPYKNRHNFFMHTDGTIRSTYKDDHVLVIKQVPQTVSGVTTNVWRMLFVADSELANTGVYPVMLLDAHTHEYGASVIDSAAKTAKRTCNVCGYEQVINGYQLQQVQRPVINNVYYMSANVNGQLISFLANGGYTETSPYSLRTSETLAIVTVKAALEAGKGEFQLADADGKLIYSVAAGAGATTSAGYISDPAKVSFFMDIVNGQYVIRAYGTNKILAAKYSDAKSAWRIFAVDESELANEGVYPVTLSVSHEHTYNDQWIANENGTTSQFCQLCGFEEIYYGGDTKVYQVEEPTIGGSYYLAADVNGVIKFFVTGTVTNTAPYSLVTTERRAVATPVTLEDSTQTDENFEGGFQLTFDNNGTVTRIYCMDVLKDATTAGQTGIMDTGTNSGTAYQNRHSFRIDEVDGVKVLRKYGNNHILVVKLMESTNTYRMLGVPEAELSDEGVYPVMLANLHDHTFGETLYGGENGHWNLCACGGKSTAQAHTVESWSVVTPPSETAAGTKTGTCTACGYTVTAEMPITVTSWNISLGDQIGANFVLTLTEGDVVTAKVGGKSVPVTLKKNGSNYTVSIQVAAAQMTEPIQFTVNGYDLEKTYSVREYADVILNGESYTQYEKSLVEAMLVYGAAAQSYFAYNTENMAYDLTAAQLAIPTGGVDMTIENNLTGIQCVAATLALRSKTAARFYFEADSIEGLVFQVNGNTYTPVSANGRYYIEVDQIKPQDLADTLTAVVTDGTNNLIVTYSPMTYMVRMYNRGSSSAQLKTLTQALYGYYQAAVNYLKNMNLANDFTKNYSSVSQLHEGVDLHEMTYIASEYGEVKAFALVVKADANVELKVAAGEVGETSAESATVYKHFQNLENAGNNVIAMTNGGFFDLNKTESYLPYGMLIVDGEVVQAPSADDPKYTDNWFGMTKDGKYVISNTAGYNSTYVDNIQQGVGGGYLLMENGIAKELSSTRAYRTAVGVNAAGDLVIICVEDALYNEVNTIFVDLDMDIQTVLNLDGGGSTAMYVAGTYWPKAKILGDSSWIKREVPDAIAIVEKN